MKTNSPPVLSLTLLVAVLAIVSPALNAAGADNPGKTPAGKEVITVPAGATFEQGKRGVALSSPDELSKRIIDLDQKLASVSFEVANMRSRVAQPAFPMAIMGWMFGLMGAGFGGLAFVMASKLNKEVKQLREDAAKLTKSGGA